MITALWADKPFCNGARIKQPVNTYGAMERHYVRRVNTVNGEHYVIDFNKYQHGFKIDDVNHVYIENTCGNWLNDIYDNWFQLNMPYTWLHGWHRQWAWNDTYD